MKKRFLNILIIFVSIFLLISIIWFFTGSSEMYHTEEKEEKIRIVSLLLGTICLIIDTVLIRIRKNMI